MGFDIVAIDCFLEIDDCEDGELMVVAMPTAGLFEVDNRLSLLLSCTI